MAGLIHDISLHRIGGNIQKPGNRLSLGIQPGKRTPPRPENCVQKLNNDIFWPAPFISFFDIAESVIDNIPGIPGNPSNPIHQRFTVFIRMLEEKGYSREEIDSAVEAFEFANKIHGGQKRISGEQYIIHPLEVAITVVETLGHKSKGNKIKAVVKELGFSRIQLVNAALLHDTIEDTETLTNHEVYKRIIKEFDETTASIVLAVTKLPKAEVPNSSARIEENFKRLFLHGSRNFGIILIKLADRLHNMRTLEHMKPEKQEKIAEETFKYFVPLADIYGMWNIKRELEDLSFKYMHPENFKMTVDNLQKTAERRSDLLKQMLKTFSGLSLMTAEFNPVVRVKKRTVFSIFEEINGGRHRNLTMLDLDTIEIIVANKKDCELAKHQIRTKFKILDDTEKDYINNPKRNFYSSWNVTVKTREFGPIRIKLRSRNMEAVNERGIAAWVFELGNNLPIGWNQFSKFWHDGISDSLYVMRDLSKLVKIITITTPKGSLVMLPEGSSVLDFAYSVHSELLLEAEFGLINGVQANLTARLKNGQTVEVVKSKNPDYEPDRLLYWIALNDLHRNARLRFRSYFRSKPDNENIKAGKSMLDAVFGEIASAKFSDLNDESKQIIFKKASEIITERLIARGKKVDQFSHIMVDCEEKLFLHVGRLFIVNPFDLANHLLMLKKIFNIST